jgi:hypothetical protein
MKPLSRQDAKTVYRVCDACDTEIENFKVPLKSFLLIIFLSAEEKSR